MHLQHLDLAFFRNYTRLELDLQACIHILQGENAQGKTNLLEAVYCLAAMKSPLASSDRLLISWHAQQEVLPFASVNGRFTRAEEEHTLDITIMNEQANGIDRLRPGLRKQVRYDGHVMRVLECIGKLNAILFLPEDVGLVSGPPGGRRRYLDASLCQQYPDYCRSLALYLRTLTQRNALLKQIRERRSSASELTYWDEQLARLGSILLVKRIQFVNDLSAYLDGLFPELTEGLETLQLDYSNPVIAADAERRQNTFDTPDAQGQERAALYENILRALLEQRRREEIARAMTVIGPHRDNLRFIVNGYDASEYGSRGQQRTISLALKLAEAFLMQSKSGESPVLLLDDIFSELDQRRSRLVLSLLERTDQVLITTTDLNACDPLLVGRARVWQVANGTVTPL